METWLATATIELIMADKDSTVGSHRSLAERRASLDKAFECMEKARKMLRKQQARHDALELKLDEEEKG